MGEFDSYLSKSSREALLRERISRFASEAYQYDLNLKVAMESGDAKSAEEAVTAIDALRIAISVHENELSALETE